MFYSRFCKLAAMSLVLAATVNARAQESNNEPSTIIIRVPAAAKLYIDDVRSSQSGATRKLVTMPLEPGYKYSYTLRVEMVQDGEPISRTKTVYFRAGETTTVDLTDLAPAKKNNPATKKPPAAAGFKPSKNERELLELVNKERDKEGLAPLGASGTLFQAAREHTANMAKQDRLDHTLDGKSPADRMEAAGYASAGWGENIAAGQRTAAEAIDSWMNSEGHRANILNAQYTEVGIGIVASEGGTPYYTLVFARPRGK